MLLGRTLGSAVATIALVLVPSAALAGEYGGDDEDMIVTETNPAPGEPFEVVVDTGAGADNDEATLTVTSQDPGVPDGAIEIAGSQSMTKSTVAGRASFTVTLNVEDAYSLVGRDEFGNVVARATVVVGDGSRGAGETGGAGDSAPSGAAGGSAGGVAGGGLGATGASVATTALAVGGSALVLAGGGILLLRRRRIETTA